MATVQSDLRGLVVILDHAETEDLLNGSPSVAEGAQGAVKTILAASGIVAAATIPVVAAAVAGYIVAEAALIRAMDQGNGVILTMPWLLPGVVIPATNHGVFLPDTWATHDTGTFASAGTDRVQWRVERGVIQPDVALFRLENRVPNGWDKAFILRDGNGGEWPIKASAGQDAENGLYADQLGRGQRFSFTKQAFIIWITAFEIGGIGNVHGGDRVTFTWIAD